MELYTNQGTLRVNNHGFINYWSNGNFIVSAPAYLVFFRDYSRLDPSCRLWDTSSPAQNIVIKNDQIIYDKEVESIKMTCSISICDDGWDWKFLLKGDYPLDHRLGIAVPSGKGSIYSLGRLVSTSIAQYYRSSQEVFPDQTFLDLPILYCRESQACIFSGTEQDSQFFIYSDGKEQYIRATISTSVSNEFVVSYRRCKEEEVPQIYVKCHPKAERYIYTWKPIFDQISSLQDIEVSCYLEEMRIESSAGEAIAHPPEDRDLKLFTTTLRNELGKYPKKFLKSIGVDGIMLCKDITVRKFGDEERVGSAKYSGIAFSKQDRAMSWILCDASLNQTWLIHHEIFHFLQDELNLEGYPCGGTTWLSAMTDDLTEQQCDLFASLMTGNHPWDTSDLRHKQSKFMKNALVDFDKRLLQEKQTPTKLPRLPIWYVRDDFDPVQIEFGTMPDPVDGVFVFDLDWYNAWQS